MRFTNNKFISGFSKEGVSLLGIGEAAEKVDFSTMGAQLTVAQLIKEIK